MSNSKVDLGSFMWSELSVVFGEVLKLNTGDEHALKSQIWTGFVAAAAGAMSKDLGPADTKMILKAITDAITEVVRSEFKVVPV